MRSRPPSPQAMERNWTKLEIHDSSTIEPESDAEDAVQCDAGLISNPTNFEDVIAAMGPPGRHQLLQCLMLSTCLIPGVFINMSYVYIGFKPAFTCSKVNETNLLQSQPYTTNGTTSFQISYRTCKIHISSNTSGTLKDVNSTVCYGGYDYNGGKDVSIITEWDLVCDSRGIAELSQTSISFGWFIGVFFNSIIADKWGRKPTIAVTTFLTCISEVSCAFAPSIYALITFRFFSGLFASGISLCANIIGMELLVSKHRETFAMYVGTLWSFYALILCGIAYLFRNNSWRDLQLCLSLSCLSPLIVIYFVNESASWLYSVGQYPKATELLRNACKTNGLGVEKINDIFIKLCAHKNNLPKDAVKPENNNHTILDIFRDKELRVIILIAWMAAFTNDITYIGMYLSASTLVGNMYLNTAVMAFLEYPGCLINLAMLRFKGRRFVVVFFMFMTAICLIVSTCLGSFIRKPSQHIANLSTAFFLLGRFAIGSSYNTASFLYIPELFPTALRSSGTGICATGACVGGMLAPYLVTLYSLVRWAPGTFLIGILAVSSLLCLKLPETKGKQLQSSLEQQSSYEMAETKYLAID